MGAFDYFTEAPRNDTLTRRVTGSKILFVEGLDECMLLDRMLGILSADKNQVQIIQYGGKQRFETNLKLLLRDNKFVDGEVRTLTVFQDADQSFVKTYHDLKRVMRDCGFPNLPLNAVVSQPSMPGISYGAFIFPDNAGAGNLETLLLLAPQQPAQRDAATQFVREHAAAKNKDDSKRVAQAYLAVQDGLCRGAGQGGRDGYFDLNAETLNDLWACLRRVLA